MKTKKPALLIIASVMMLLSALPMLLWCLELINSAAMDYTYAGAGCFAAALLYAFSMVTAIAGLVYAGRLIAAAGAGCWPIFNWRRIILTVPFKPMLH